MKHLKITALLAAAITFAFSACSNEKAALANFKTEVEGVTKWAEEKTKAASTDPTASMAVVPEIVAKFKAIKTDGLPADLKTAWADMNVVLGEMADLFKGMPKIDASKPEETGKAMQDFMPKMMAIQGKMDPVGKKLDEVGKKYGLDMKKVSTGGK